MKDLKAAKVLYLDGRYEEAQRLLYELASEGDAEAAFDYAYLLWRAPDLNNDATTAATFFKFSSYLVPEANYNLALMYMHGDGVEKDFSKSYSYMRDAAEAGVIEAQLYLGVAHTMGYLYEPDVVAISLLPFHTPIYRDARLMLEGSVPDMEAEDEGRSQAVRQDLSSAFEWFKKSALHSSDYVEDFASKGKFLFARCFIDGVGTDYNRDLGNRLMLVAASEGSAEAYEYIKTDAPYLLSEPENRDVAEYIIKLHDPERLTGGRK